jgi:hypothetical protein
VCAEEIPPTYLTLNAKPPPPSSFCAPLSSLAHARTTCALARAACPRLSCLVCAEAYAWGDWGNNTCPGNATRIGSEEACQRAARGMGARWEGGSMVDTKLPSGCSANKGGGVFFNAHTVGSGDQL